MLILEHIALQGVTRCEECRERRLYLSIPLIHCLLKSLIQGEKLRCPLPQIVPFCLSGSQFILESSDFLFRLLTRSALILRLTLMLRQLLE